MIQIFLSKASSPWFSLLTGILAQSQTVRSVRGAGATNPEVPSLDRAICNDSAVEIGNISPLRIASVFFVLAASALGIILPFIPEVASRDTTLGRKSRLFWEEVFFILKHIGTGVIVATAFVHLIYEATVELESPCINLSYKPLSPVLSMSSLGIIFLCIVG